MRVDENLRRLYADAGMVLTNGESYGREVVLGDLDCAENWTEIDEADIPEEITAEELQEMIEEVL